MNPQPSQLEKDNWFLIDSEEKEKPKPKESQKSPSNMLLRSKNGKIRGEKNTGLNINEGFLATPLMQGRSPEECSGSPNGAKKLINMNVVKGFGGEKIKSSFEVFLGDSKNLNTIQNSDLFRNLHQHITPSRNQSNTLALRLKERRDAAAPNFREKTHEKRFERDFEVDRTMGKGDFGKVLKVMDRNDGYCYALKQIAGRREEHEAEIKKQARISGLVSCKHVVRYQHSFYEQGKWNIVMEYCRTTLKAQFVKAVKQKKKLGKTEILRIIKHVGKGLRALHKRGIAHLDIKPENILLGSGPGKPIYKIGDMGHAQFTQFFFETVKLVNQQQNSVVCNTSMISGDKPLLNCVIEESIEDKGLMQIKENRSAEIKPDSFGWPKNKNRRDFSDVKRKQPPKKQINKPKTFGYFPTPENKLSQHKDGVIKWNVPNNTSLVLNSQKALNTPQYMTFSNHGSHLMTNFNEASSPGISERPHIQNVSQNIRGDKSFCTQKSERNESANLKKWHTPSNRHGRRNSVVSDNNTQILLERQVKEIKHTIELGDCRYVAGELYRFMGQNIHKSVYKGPKTPKLDQYFRFIPKSKNQRFNNMFTPRGHTSKSEKLRYAFGEQLKLGIAEESPVQKQISPQSHQSLDLNMLQKADIFSFGLVILQLLSLPREMKLPENGILWRSIRETPEFFINLLDCSEDLKNLLTQMLDKNSEKRPTAKGVLNIIKQIQNNRTFRSSFGEDSRLSVSPFNPSQTHEKGNPFELSNPTKSLKKISKMRQSEHFGDSNRKSGQRHPSAFKQPQMGHSNHFILNKVEIDREILRRHSLIIQNQSHGTLQKDAFFRKFSVKESLNQKDIEEALRKLKKKDSINSDGQNDFRSNLKLVFDSSLETKKDFKKKNRTTQLESTEVEIKKVENAVKLIGLEFKEPNQLLENFENFDKFPKSKKKNDILKMTSFNNTFSNLNSIFKNSESYHKSQNKKEIKNKIEKTEIGKKESWKILDPILTSNHKNIQETSNQKNSKQKILNKNIIVTTKICKESKPLELFSKEKSKKKKCEPEKRKLGELDCLRNPFSNQKESESKIKNKNLIKNSNIVSYMNSSFIDSKEKRVGNSDPLVKPQKISSFLQKSKEVLFQLSDPIKERVRSNKKKKGKETLSPTLILNPNIVNQKINLISFGPSLAEKSRERTDQLDYGQDQWTIFKDNDHHNQNKEMPLAFTFNKKKQKKKSNSEEIKKLLSISDFEKKAKTLSEKKEETEKNNMLSQSLERRSSFLKKREKMYSPNLVTDPSQNLKNLEKLKNCDNSPKFFLYKKTNNQKIRESIKNSRKSINSDPVSIFLELNSEVLAEKNNSADLDLKKSSFLGKKSDSYNSPSSSDNKTNLKKTKVEVISNEEFQEKANRTDSQH